MKLTFGCLSVTVKESHLCSCALLQQLHLFVVGGSSFDGRGHNDSTLSEQRGQTHLSENNSVQGGDVCDSAPNRKADYLLLDSY